MNARNLKVADHLQGLFEYLLGNGFIRRIEDYREDYLSIFSRDALEKIRSGDDNWKTMVPEGVMKLIKERDLFGHKA